MSTPSSRPRIEPGGRREIGRLTWTIMQLLARRTGGPVPNMMLVLARHRKMFRPWLWFASTMMPYGSLPATDTELVILRVGSRCGSAYERLHHEPLGRAAGLGDAIIAWTDEPVGEATPAPAGAGIDPARATLLRDATDELVDTRNLSDETWTALAAILREHELIELCMLIGHYVMIAGTLNAVRVPLDARSGMHTLR